MTMHALLALTLLAAPSNATIGNDLSAGGTSSASKVTSAGTVEGYRFSYPVPTTDAAPGAITLKATNAYGPATGTSRAGAPLTLSGGMPSTLLTVADKANSGGDTITWTRTVNGVTPANVVWTEGAQYACAAAADNAACALAIKTYCNANLPSGVTACSCTDGTCSDAKVFIKWDDATTVAAYVTSSDDTGISDNSSLALLGGPVGFVVYENTSSSAKTPARRCLHLNYGAIYASDCVTTAYGSATSWIGSFLEPNGNFSLTGFGFRSRALTAGTMSLSSYGILLVTGTTVATWTNAMVVALGAVASGDIKVATLPAKYELVDMQVVIDTACQHADTLTVSVGRTGANYIDYIVASDAKAAANTVYGDTAGERGTNLTGYDVPSWTGTTDIYAHFIAGSGHLDDVTTCVGHVVITTRALW
jgi:hypothetical protein